MKHFHIFLSKMPLTAPLMRYLSYVRNEYFRPNPIRMLAKTMPKGWKNMTVLNAGSGRCAMEEHPLFRGANIICLDIYKPYLKSCKALGFKTIHADLLDIDKHFSSKSVDFVWFFNVIEHFPKKEGILVLKKLEKICRKSIIVFAPLGYSPQDTWKGNVYQRHLSSWEVSDFTRLGYDAKKLKKFHGDIRCHSSELKDCEHEVCPDAVWAVKHFYKK